MATPYSSWVEGLADRLACWIVWNKSDYIAVHTSDAVHIPTNLTQKTGRCFAQSLSFSLLECICTDGAAIAGSPEPVKSPPRRKDCLELIKQQ